MAGRWLSRRFTLDSCFCLLAAAIVCASCVINLVVLLVVFVTSWLLICLFSVIDSDNIPAGNLVYFCVPSFCHYSITFQLEWIKRSIYLLVNMYWLAVSMHTAVCHLIFGLMSVNALPHWTTQVVVSLKFSKMYGQLCSGPFLWPNVNPSGDIVW